MANFILPKKMHMQISTNAQANYTQAAVFEIWSAENPPRLLLHHRSENFWNQSSFVLPTHTYDQDSMVSISAQYLYTRSAWGTSAEKIWESSENHVLLGYDDARHREHDNDYNDYMIDITFKPGDPVLLSARDFLAEAAKSWKRREK
ncbi:hypothetical protein CQ050_13610 [Achromobacter sp. MYb9]|uniref:hypothetical protein n=1 Tax=Achromobacter sp. MYb9 TaxID=1827284 RepID=UPI000CFB635B|nr:hypothetical protein [Achromobacter sp. MYb9]PQZ68288.1 hypothetical protein CQ050_13610 [Achromobacter sp. MYb9]